MLGTKQKWNIFRASLEGFAAGGSEFYLPESNIYGITLVEILGLKLKRVYYKTLRIVFSLQQPPKKTGWPKPKMLESARLGSANYHKINVAQKIRTSRLFLLGKVFVGLFVIKSLSYKKTKKALKWYVDSGPFSIIPLGFYRKSLP